MDYDDRIDEFLQGKMSEEEQKLFMGDMDTDTELRERAETTAVLAYLLIEQERQRDAQTVDRVLQRKQEQDRRHHTQRRRLTWLSIAAGILILLGITQIYTLRMADRLFEAYYQSPPKVVMRGGDEQANKSMVELFNSIGTDTQLSSVVAELEKARTQVDSDVVAHAYRYEIDWYLALAYTKNHQLLKARRLLQSIANDPQQPYRDKAQQMLEGEE